MWMQNFYGNRTVRNSTVSLKDGSHTACANDLLELIFIVNDFSNNIIQPGLPTKIALVARIDGRACLLRYRVFLPWRRDRAIGGRMLNLLTGATIAFNGH